MPFKGFFKVLALFLVTISMSACVIEDIKNGGGSSSTDGGGSGGEDIGDFVYDGCIDGQGVGTASIIVNYLFPDEATRVRIRRNGIEVAQFSSDPGCAPTPGSVNPCHIDNDNLREGATYLYTCEAFIDGLWSEGRRSLTLTTEVENAPANFNGIATAISTDPDTVKVTWVPTVSDNPVPAFSYEIYSNVGATIDWTKESVGTVLQGSTPEFDITGLGDELTYSFGVRACSEGGICETDSVVNNVFLTVYTPDTGAPTTVGATAASLINGRIEITAPWTEQEGGIFRRYVYVRNGAVGGTNVGDYRLERTYALSGNDLSAPPELLEIVNLVEGQTYHIIVQDEDPSGQRSTVTDFQTIVVDDITPPAFGGITNITQGSPADSVLTVSWTAIDTEAVDPISGGTTYRILALSASSPIIANPCSDGTQLAELNVADYVAGANANFDITGLNERSYYKVCIKAVDAVGNVSVNDNSLQDNTLDITSPDFFGLETISYENQAGTLNLSWNASQTEDIDDYKVTLWTNQPAPPPTPTVIFREHANFATGTSITGVEFSINDNDEVFALVEACDGTEPPFGTKNCSSIGIIRSVIVPDVTPPPNFTGIRGPTELVSSTEGSMDVLWNAPADWSDYRGFRVYSVNTATSELTLLRNCPCVDYGCSDQITQCTITGLNPYRTYRFHVRAYDDDNNETIYLDPTVSFADKRVIDTTAPAFASNLTVGVSPVFELNWSAAVDNQFPTEPGAEIRYRVYQNNGPFDFTNPNQPDGNLKTETLSTTFVDSGFLEGATYFYTVCAVDASDNVSCDQLTRNFTVPDVTDPVIENLVTDKTVKGRVWELSWEMSDNISAFDDLTVEIRRRVSVSGDLAQNTDPVIYSGSGSDVLVAANAASTSVVVTLDPLRGEEDLNREINYLLTVRDEVGNESTANVGVTSNNAVTVTNVSPSTGPISGGQTITVYGTGFLTAADSGTGEDTSVTISGRDCASVEIISEQALYCVTPAVTVPGQVEVRVSSKINNPSDPSNNLFSEDATTTLYAYSATPVLCDDPGSWGAFYAAGTGTEVDPYIVCNVTHLNQARTDAATGSFYQLGQTIDLASEVNFAPLGNSTTEFSGGFDGDGKLILNWSYTGNEANIGFFGHVNNDFTIKDLGLVNVNIDGAQSVGGLIGLADGGVNRSGSISNSYVTGAIIGDAFIGGLIGRKQGDHINFNVINSYFIGSVEATTSTGYVGGIFGLTGTALGGNFNSVYSEGTVTGTARVGGLFGNLGDNKQLINSFSRASITATGTNSGGLAAEVGPGALIDSSYTESGTITGVDSTGGLVGNLEGSLTNSESRVSVVSTGRRAGGAVGIASDAVITNVSSSKDHTFDRTSGGLVGELLNSDISNSFATGAITSVDAEVGGLIGKVTAGSSETISISEVYSLSNISSGSGNSIGGLIGLVEAQGNSVVNMSEVFATGNVGDDFQLPTQNYSGLVGAINTQTGSSVNTTDCFSRGTVNAGSNAGGLMGGFLISLGSINFTRCYTSSPLLGGSAGRGGLFGASDSHISVTDVIWDRESTDQDFAAGSGVFNGAPISYTTSEMQDFANSVYVGWDFVSVWREPATAGYPELRFAN